MKCSCEGFHFTAEPLVSPLSQKVNAPLTLMYTRNFKYQMSYVQIAVYLKPVTSNHFDTVCIYEEKIFVKEKVFAYVLD